MFELTYRCNFSCAHCYVPSCYKEKSKENELSTNEIFSILDQLAEIGCLYLGFTGGEVFVREDILDILWYAKRKGFEIIIYTNGSLINKKVASELKKLRPNKIDITIPAMSKYAFERITAATGSHRKVFNAVELLYAHQIDLGFKSCVLQDNQFEIHKIASFARLLEAHYRIDDILSPRLDGSKEPYQYRGYLDNRKRLSTQGAKPKELIGCNAQITQRTLSGKTLFKCGVGQTQAAITPFGELKMCVMIDHPKFKILESSFSQSWEDLKQFVHEVKTDGEFRCTSCDLAQFCKWCPARSWLDHKSFCGCDKESRQLATLKSQDHELIA